MNLLSYFSPIYALLYGYGLRLVCIIIIVAVCLGPLWPAFKKMMENRRQADEQEYRQSAENAMVCESVSIPETDPTKLLLQELVSRFLPPGKKYLYCPERDIPDLATRYHLSTEEVKKVISDYNHGRCCL